MVAARRRRKPLAPDAVFRRYKDGESLSDIARSFGQWPGTVHALLRRFGGIAPRKRKRAARALTLAEREEISRGLRAGETQASIAHRLGRSPATVSREIARNGGPLEYRAARADERAWVEGLRPKDCKLLKSPELARLVSGMLMENWSPQQIQKTLELLYPNNPSMNVSHETIYRTLFIQARGALKKELLKHLRSKRVMRGPKRAKPADVLGDVLSIRERPAEVEDRAVPGHWEGDLIAGHRNQSFIGTLVERRTRFVKLIQVDSKNAVNFAAALAREVLRLPQELRRTVTWDRGTEMARHKDFTVATNVKVYFCDPHSPWQRGSNENTNGLLRQYFPKGMVLSGLTQDQLDLVAKQLNERPRETLGWSSPADALRKLIKHSSELPN
jgi:IS30 family transposase